MPPDKANAGGPVHRPGSCDGVLIRDLTSGDGPWLRELIATTWGLPVVSTSGQHDPADLPGFVAEQGERRVGVLTYRLDLKGMEVVTLNSLLTGHNIGSALLEKARSQADRSGVRLWLITTDENTRAIRFYQRRGMDMVVVHRGFVDVVKQAKPVPEGFRIGGFGFRDALEFEYPLTASHTLPNLPV